VWRYANARLDADLIDAFGVEDVRDPELEPLWNVAPMQDVRIGLERLAKEEPQEPVGRQQRTTRWGGTRWPHDGATGSTTSVPVAHIPASCQRAAWSDAHGTVRRSNSSASPPNSSTTPP